MSYERTGYTRQNMASGSDAEVVTIVSDPIPFHEDGVSLFGDDPVGEYIPAVEIPIPAYFLLTASKLDILEAVLPEEGDLTPGSTPYFNVLFSEADGSVGAGTIDTTNDYQNAEATPFVTTYFYGDTETTETLLIQAFANPDSQDYNPVSGIIRVTLYGSIVPDPTSAITPPELPA